LLAFVNCFFLLLSVSTELQWECIRKFNCFIVKRDGAVFSTERGNLMNKHSLKYSGLVQPRVVRVEAAVAGVSLSRRRSKAGSKVATAFSRPALVKSSSGIKTVQAKIAGDLEKSFYRRDLICAAKKRAARLIKTARAANKN
jgi:large subunit ribosomal protein L28e